MLGLIFTILLIVALFKVTGFLLHICGKLLGAMFGVLGYLLLAILAVTVFGLAAVALPVILIIGIGSVVGALAGA